MGEPVVLSGGDVVVPGASAALVAAALREAARSSLQVAPEVRAVLVALSAAARLRAAPSTLGHPNPNVVAVSQTGRGLSGEITTAEAAEMLSCSTESVRLRVASGALPGRKVGKTWLVDRQAVEALREKRSS